jgi:hypothetical protein
MRRKSIFEGSDSIFQDRDIDQDNPLVSLEEQAKETPHVATAGAETLMAVFEEGGYPMVAKAAVEAGEVVPCEALRPPTAEEFGLVKSQGKFIKGGIVNQTPYCYDVPQMVSGLGTVTETIMANKYKIGIGVLLIGGGIWWFWKRKRDRGE